MLFRTPPSHSRNYVPAQLPVPVRSIERRHVISEELFHDALVRERKRADRFEEAFALLMITIDRRRLGPAGRRAACRVDVAIATGRRRDWLARAGFRAGSDSIDPGARARRHRHGARQRLPPRAGADAWPPIRRVAVRFAAKLTPHAATPSLPSSWIRASGATDRGRWRGWRRSVPWISPAVPRVSWRSVPCSCALPLR